MLITGFINADVECEAGVICKIKWGSFVEVRVIALLVKEFPCSIIIGRGERENPFDAVGCGVITIVGVLLTGIIIVVGIMVSS